MLRAAIVAALLGTIAHGAPAPAVIAALAAPETKDVRDTVLLGPNGQVYEPDGNGAWIRHHTGGIADDVVRASRAGGRVIVGVESGPPYAYAPGKTGDGAWHMVVLGLHAKAIVGHGPRATAAFGRQVFGLETGTPVRLTDAPAPVLTLAASRKSVVIVTDQGLARLVGQRWKSIAIAPAQVTALLDDRWALVDRGLLDLRAGKVTAWPTGFRPSAVFAVDNDLVVAAGTQGANLVLVTLKAGKLDHELIGVRLATVVALAADRAGRVVVAARDGQLAVRDKQDAWTATAVRDELPAGRPGSPPAVQP
ncbi:hypothetical protein BH11MYX1_BH11MYX1_20810 [soil metagenome]